LAVCDLQKYQEIKIDGLWKTFFHQPLTTVSAALTILAIFVDQNGKIPTLTKVSLT
jgi:hypothetical protein